MQKLIGVMGGAACTREEYLLAADVGNMIAINGLVLLCGGGTGIMEAAARGAREAGGLTIGILPGSSAEETPPNPFIDIPVFTGLSDARNAVNAKSSALVIAIGGGFGTLSEIALALKCRKHVIGLKTWTFDREDMDLSSFHKAETIRDVEKILLDLLGGM
jgi:hypothetical protein